MLSDSPIFIIGAPRSGTTLLRLLLDAHPAIAAGPETRFLLDLAKIFDQHWDRLSRFGFERAAWVAKVARFFAETHEEYAASRGKRRWCEKTPRYTIIADLVDELYPDAQFLHIIRDGFDVVASHKDRWGHASALEAIDDWKMLVGKACKFGAKVGPQRYHELRYEALVADPEGALRPVFEFLGETWHPEVLESTGQTAPKHYAEHTARRREEGGADGPIYASRVGVGRQELGFWLRRRFVRRAGKLHRELGYS